MATAVQLHDGLPRKLYCFDVDGTLIDREGNLLDGVREGFAWLSTMKPTPFLAFTSNQGGVGLRLWMEVGGFGSQTFIDTLPTSEQIAQAHQDLAKKLTPLDVMCFQSYAYQSKTSLKWSPPPLNLSATDKSAWSQEWRKPSPGMLLEAMKRAGATPAETLMVGNSSDDYEAAEAAGVTFMWAWQFFGRPEPSQDLP